MFGNDIILEQALRRNGFRSALKFSSLLATLTGL